ncbi:MAG: amidohydrolase [Microscillaceae bacterium]|nr:amidohydrolase [Microscillaceae bacterium]MDW8459924.1 amidohydrolase [Cytophagales bacterium]
MKIKYLQFLYFGLISLFLLSCQSKQSVDSIFYNALVYTSQDQQPTAEAFAIKDGKFVAVGTTQEILAKYDAKEKIDVQKKPIYAGFHDAHCHFYGYGKFLNEANLVGATSWDEILERLKKFDTQNPNNTWLIGRGWDQNLWQNKEFPTKEKLDQLFPNKPVFLTRIDGHAAIVNQKALQIAQIQADTQIQGGILIKQNNQLTGVLIDNAIKLVEKYIPEPSPTEIKKYLLSAQEKCFAVGLTSIADAGLDRKVIETIEQAHAEQSLKMRIYAMVSSTPDNLAYYLKKGKIKTDFLNVCSFKIYADGALGSRGACLLQPYSDSPKEYGILLKTPQELVQLIKQISEKDFQVCTHAIGDSANRLVLNIYKDLLKGKNDKRWRIEHAQVVAPTDFDKFGQYNIIPSVQPTHCTSDMHWAKERLGKDRLQFAYAYKALLKQNNYIPLGSDFPVEDINPLYGFHAAVARQDANGEPKGGFQMENALTRQEALKGMTIWAAKANFEDQEKGSIEPNKWADFVILDQDIMQIPIEKIRNVKVISTYIAGKKVFERK